MISYSHMLKMYQKAEERLRSRRAELQRAARAAKFFGLGHTVEKHIDILGAYLDDNDHLTFKAARDEDKVQDKDKRDEEFGIMHRFQSIR
jgi:hypothetical protein